MNENKELTPNENLTTEEILFTDIDYTIQAENLIYNQEILINRIELLIYLIIFLVVLVLFSFVKRSRSR